MTTKEIGDFGENTACEYLKKSGYSIVQRNFHSRYGEIDIIALDKTCTVFVEVKTRKNALYGNASEYVDYRKRQKLLLCAKYYLSGNIYEEVRFDVIEVYYNMNGETLFLKEINQRQKKEVVVLVMVKD